MCGEKHNHGFPKTVDLQNIPMSSLRDLHNSLNENTLKSICQGQLAHRHVIKGFSTMSLIKSDPDLSNFLSKWPR